MNFNWLLRVTQQITALYHGARVKMGYVGFAKFNEARQGKAEWAEVGVLGIVGAIVLIFASYLLTEASGVI